LEKQFRWFSLYFLSLKKRGKELAWVSEREGRGGEKEGEEREGAISTSPYTCRTQKHAYAYAVYTVGWASVVVVEVAINLFQRHRHRTRGHRLWGPHQFIRHVGLTWSFGYKHFFH